jgi:serine/threonine protein kinase
VRTHSEPAQRKLKDPPPALPRAQAGNVLLARCSGAAGAVPAAGPAALAPRFAAKVSDFGLSLYLEPEATHVPRTHAGTLTHMSPELLLAGRASKASDVYAVSGEGREGQSGARTARQQRAVTRRPTPPLPSPRPSVRHPAVGAADGRPRL